MRQLGGHSPEPPEMTMAPPVATEASQADVDMETPAAEPQPEPLRVVLEPHEARQPDPYPVEVHRIERQFVDPPLAETADSAPARFVPPSDVLPVEESAAAEPAPKPASPDVAAEPVDVPVPPPPSVASPTAETDDTPPPRPIEPRRPRQQAPLLRITEAEPEPNLASGRWEEFSELPRRGLRRGGETKLDSRPPIPLAGWGLDAEKPVRRSSFFKVALVVIAVLIAIGAIVWGGYLRDRLNQQDAQMSALKDQNRKLAESLVSVSSAHENANGAAPAPPSEPPATSQPKAATPPPSDNAPTSAKENAPANAQENAPASSPKQSQQNTASREGVSHPLPQSSVAPRGSRPPVDANYHPEIVPPYPTLSQSQNVAAASVPTPTAPKQQSYNQPLNAPSSGRAAAPSRTASAGAATSPRAAGSSGTSRPALVNPPSTGSSDNTYTATSNGMYASALAQNIEAVEALQQQSAVPLREFHARAGAQAQAAPGVTISVQAPDQARGSYGLVVSGGGTRYQLRGHVNSPLAFTDNFNHRVYELVILQIAGGEAYGYIRSAQQ